MIKQKDEQQKKVSSWQDMSAEYYRRDEEFKRLVKTGDIAKIKELYPDAQALLKYSNTYNPNLHRDSFLAILCQYGSPFFVQQFFKTYFKGTDSETQTLKTYTHESLNYHWFKRYLPADLTKRVESAFERKESKFISSQVDADKKEIYEIIKKQYASLQARRNEKVKPSGMSLTLDEEKPGYTYYLMGTDANGNEIIGAHWVDEAIPPIILRKLPEAEKHDSHLRDDQTAVLELFSVDNLLEKVYKELPFPEDFIWAAPSLKRLEDEYKQVVGDPELRAHIKPFVQKGGHIIIEDGQRKKANINLLGGRRYQAFSNGQDVVFDAKVYHPSSGKNDNTLAHELGHDADRKSHQIVSNIDWAKWAFMLVDFGAVSPLRISIYNQVVHGYPPRAHVTEFLANLTQRPQEVIEKDEKGNFKDPLLASIYQLVSLRADCVAHKEEWLEKMIELPPLQGKEFQLLKDLYPEYLKYAEGIRLPFVNKEITEDEFNKKRDAFQAQFKAKMGDVSRADLEKALVGVLRQQINCIKSCKKEVDASRKIYRQNCYKKDSISAHTNYLMNVALDPLKQAIKNNDPSAMGKKVAFLTYMEDLAASYWPNMKSNASLIELPDHPVSIESIERAANTLCELVKHGATYEEFKQADSCKQSIPEFRKAKEQTMLEFARESTKGNAQNWIENKLAAAWTKDAPMEAKRDFVLSVIAMQEVWLSKGISDRVLNDGLNIGTKKARAFVQNMGLLRQGLSPKIFESLGLMSGVLPPTGYDDVCPENYENCSDSRKFDRTDLLDFIAIGQEYMRRTGAKELPKDLRLSSLTPDDLMNPKGVFQTMGRYYHQMEDEPQKGHLQDVVKDLSQKRPASNSKAEPVSTL